MYLSIDLSAVVDRVNHQGIIYKLCFVGIGGSVLSLPRCIKVGGETDSAIRRRKRTIVTLREEQRKLDVKNISATFVKNAFYLL